MAWSTGTLTAVTGRQRAGYGLRSTDLGAGPARLAAKGQATALHDWQGVYEKKRLSLQSRGRGGMLRERGSIERRGIWEAAQAGQKPRGGTTMIPAKLSGQQKNRRHLFTSACLPVLLQLKPLPYPPPPRRRLVPSPWWTFTFAASVSSPFSHSIQPSS